MLNEVEEHMEDMETMGKKKYKERGVWGVKQWWESWKTGSKGILYIEDKRRGVAGKE
jgi:hypothetical protein